jgi:hypothetical protein
VRLTGNYGVVELMCFGSSTALDFCLTCLAIRLVDGKV